MIPGKYRRPVRALSLFTLGCFVLYGAVCTLLPLFPLWIDELTLVDNLKFKPAGALWHGLDHTQQFPRVYLQLVKLWTAACDYSYTSLRLPAFLAHCGGILLMYQLSGRIFGKEHPLRFLWLLLYISYNTSIHYFFFVKQYTMEMGLGVVGMLQYLELMKAGQAQPEIRRRLLLYASFAVAPFFSYTYPIVAAPILAIAGLRSLRRRHWPATTAIALGTGALSIAAAYLLDLRHVVADPGMQEYWRDMMGDSVNPGRYLAGVFSLCSNLGSGDVFGAMYGILGIAALLWATRRCLKRHAGEEEPNELLVRYSCLLAWTVIGLFIVGKLPLGSFRLTAFAVPAIGLLLINLLKDAFARGRGWMTASAIAATLMMLTCVGNTFTTMGEVLTEQHRKKIRIYAAVGAAIRESERRRLPLLVSSSIAYPYEGTEIASWVFRTHPYFRTGRRPQARFFDRQESMDAAVDATQAPASVILLLDGDSLRAMPICR